ncbi:ATP-binding protein [Natrinema thermotolerans]
MASSADTDPHSRIRHQVVVAELGQQALETDDIDQLMHDACVAVAETLSNDYCKVLELLPGGDELFLRQGVGWREGLVGSAIVPTDRGSQAGYTLLSEEPVVVDDLRTEERFSGPELLTSHDVVGGISVIIGSIENPWGILGVHATEKHEFTDHDVTFVKNVANVLAAAIEETRAKRKLEERETELERTFERITDGFVGLDEDWIITYANERGKNVLDPEDEGLVGENFWEVFEPALGTTFEEEYREAVRTQEPTSFEEYYPPLGTWFEVHAYPSESGLSVYFRDVTKRKERERKLKESERRYRTLAEFFPNGIVTLFGADLEYTLAAGQAFAELPISPADVEERTPAQVWGDTVAADLEPALRAALDGDETSVEFQYVNRDWRVHAVPVTDDDGEVFAGMTMAQDITEQNERKQQLEDTVEKLEKSNERLEQFAYAASHDLQEPLRMVSSYLQLLERRYEDTLDEEGEEFLEFAVDGADRMRAMVDGLLQYSRVDTEGDPLEPVDLNAVLDDVLADLQLQLEETDADITAASLPRVEGDASQLRQLFQNLLDNAVTYAGDEPPRIAISAERAGRDWVVSISDEGMGIDPDDQAAVFEVFQRLHGPHEHAGTGIGLALCERIIERHDGEIWVDSEPGDGSTFSFTLPAPRDRDA